MPNQAGRLRNSIVMEPGEASLDNLKSMYRSTAGVYFAINPQYYGPIQDLIGKVRSEMAKAKAAGRFLAYLSVPVSSKGGGHFETNNAIAQFVARAVEVRFGSGLSVVNSAAFSLEPVGGAAPGGGEYMAVWSDVIAGPDGHGDEFDLVYFVGPNDVAQFFGLSDAGRIDTLDKWIEAEAAKDPEFRKFITTGDNRRQFLRYYALRGSSVYSKGGHDEWNIVVGLNSKRPTGEDIAVYFDGRPVEPGDYDELTDPGYQAL